MQISQKESKTLAYSQHENKFYLLSKNSSCVEEVKNDDIHSKTYSCINDMKNLARYHAKIVPPEHRDKYCILFGDRILFTTSDKEEAMSNYNEYFDNNIIVTLYSPAVDN